MNDNKICNKCRHNTEPYDKGCKNCKEFIIYDDGSEDVAYANYEPISQENKIDQNC